MKIYGFIIKYKFLLFWSSLFLGLIFINLIIKFSSEPVYSYSNPDEMLQKARIGELVALYGYKGSDDFKCTKKTEELTECEWFFKENPSSKVIVQFNKSSKISPEQGSYFNVRVKSRNGNILIAEAVGVNIYSLIKEDQD